MKNQELSTIKKWIQLCAVMVLSMGIALPLGAQVGEPGIFADRTCDLDYLESLKARAWMEAQREIVQNQNLIVKPDSVLEYSCFDRQLNVLAYYARKTPPGGELFSGTYRWGTPPTNMLMALQNLTGTPLIAYDTQNFNHAYLGGRMGSVSNDQWVPQGYEMQSLAEDPNYTCNEMDKVWKYAKCMDFIDKPHDEFFTFAEHSRDDKRKLPEPCENIAPWNENIRIATGAGVPWERDPLKTYLEYIYPRDPSRCGDPRKSKLPTGVMVYNSTHRLEKYLEHVCIVPGCYYDPTDIEEGTCKLPG